MARHELWVELADRPGNLAALAGDLAACDANIVHLDIHAGRGATVVDRLVVDVPPERTTDLIDVAHRAGATLRHLDREADTGARTGDDPDARAGAGTGDDHPAADRGARPGGVSPATRAGTGGRTAGRNRADQVDPGAEVRTAFASHPANVTSRRKRAPTTLERLVALGDGGLVRLRHLTTGDRAALVAHHERCSAATRRHSRFLVPGLLPAPRPIGDAAPAGADDHVALAALTGGEVIGVGRFDVADGGALATLAVMVEDRHQRRGIGTLLIAELAVLASNAEIRRLRAVAPAAGDVLAATLRRAGLAFTARREGEVLVFDCGLPEGLSASA
jgi:GNAT superfamily N-acetyltransferase